MEIDLTGDSDSDDTPVAKEQKKAANSNAARKAQSQQHGDAAAYHTPPASSAPKSSQTGYQSDQYELVYPPQISAENQHSLAERETWLADNDGEDFNQLIGSTQAAAANTEQLHRYGDLNTKIVGVQYYRGHANAGEQVLMRREPSDSASEP